MALLFTKCLVSNAQALDPAQVYTTENLVGNTNNAWSGCYTNRSGSFWGGTSGGPCPGYDANTGQIIFSYGQHTLSQTIAINQALANAGSGLQVNGYNYSWNVKNSNINGQQPGSFDPIAYVDVNLYSSTGSLLVNDRYNYGYHLPQWTTFSGTRTYTNPYDLSALGSIQLSVTGRDSGFWAGYYGAEFNNFNLRLNYSLNPCVQNPLYSPTCPGYGAAYLAANAKTTTAAPATTYNASSGYTAVALTPDSTRTDPTVTNAGGVELSTAGTITPPDGVPTVSREAVVAGNNSSREEKATTNPAALNIALNTVRRNAEREQSIVRDVLRSNEQQSLQVRSSQDTLVNDLVSRTQEQSQSIALSVTVNSALNLTALSSRPQQSEAQSRTEDASNSAFSLGSPTNPLQNSLQPRLPDTNANSQQTGPTVNRNTPNNSLAGGVDIAAIARSPAGFEMYMNGMADRPFYEPKEIYRGQRNVDNARAERYLNGSSEIRHQMMIEQQYNLGR